MNNEAEVVETELLPCPFCGMSGKPDPVNEHWFTITHTEPCWLTQNGRNITAHHAIRHENWNTRVSTSADYNQVRDAVKGVPTYIRGKGYDQAKTLAHYRRDVLAAIDSQLES